MNYGNFSSDRKEYIITDQRTPSPWINYIYNGRYFSTISNNGGGISYYKSPLHGRITRYRINDVPPDRPGKYIYIRDNDTAEAWSLTWQPVGKHPESYKVAHGFGYTRAEASVNEIDSSAVFFVPRDDDQELWKTRLTNTSVRTRHLSVYGYVELALGHALVDLINQSDDQHFNRAYFDKELNTLFSTKTYWVTETKGTQHQENKEWDQWAFFTVNHPIAGFETNRERFLGSYRNESNPESIEKENLSCKDSDYGNIVNALKLDIELAAGESIELVFSLGVIEKEKFENQKKKIVSKYHSIKEADHALSEIKRSWDTFFSFTSVETPDDEVNTFMNYWIPYQAKVAFDVGRVVSYYYWGIGRGFGFRDTCQDILAITISNPEKAREHIKLLSRQMQINGEVYHHFYSDGQGEFTSHCDDSLWYILAVTEYLKETGDYFLLDEEQPYIEGESASILEHMFSVVNYARNNLGVHGLPIFGRGDWNDTLDYIGGNEGGESVWGGIFYVAMLNRFIELLEHLGKDPERKRVIKVRDALIRSVDDNCWDGDWYIRAFGENGRKIGSKANKSGKIFLNTQTWSVIAGFPDRKRLHSAMESVKKYLDSPEGPKKCSPAWKEIDPKIGLVTRCVRGKKENGAVFCHPVSWAIQAEAILGHGNQAFEYFRKMLPNRLDSDTFITEPYVYSQYITSNEYSSAGRASHSWQTGTAAWMFRVGYDYMLGVRPTHPGLSIDPVIPSKWKEFRIVRKYRGTNYIIHVSNPNGVEKGIKSIICSGKICKGNLLPLTREAICRVDVMMG